jgi:hypothetical protein
MKAKNIMFIVLTVFGLNACVSKRAVVSKNESIDFNNYKTYSWEKPDFETLIPEYKEEYIDHRIKSSVEKEMNKRRMVKVDKDSDVLIRYHTYTQDKEVLSGSYYPGPNGYYPSFYPYNGFYGPYYPYSYGGTGYNMPTVYNYTEGTLILDLIDSHSHKVVWTGAIDGKIDEPLKIDKKIDKGVQVLFKKFPVKESM